ncbi:LysM domain-containing protein [Cordyceps javanica]|uniref:LysM domain-containing protein n=1 Tax=Cordyceps javanica TaxID=43265 RepID=A0A545URM3_9HYPO|nr:LysM domain-containing protein [Cordyceps javanica]
MAFLWYAATLLAALTAAHRLFRLHGVHSLFTNCVARTDTRHQTRFENLRRFFIPDGSRGSKLPNLVTFEFQKDAVIVEVPAGSFWSYPRVCHHTQEMCGQFYILSGWWYLDGFLSGVPGEAPPERLHSWRSFHNSHAPATTTAQIRVSGSEKARQLDHLIASAVQDAEVYFKLCSTPLWLRLVYAAARAVSPAAADLLARRVLWVQIRAMFFRHDTWEYRGRCTVFRWWYAFLNAPDWVIKFEEWSEYYASKQFLRLNYWLGHVCLGMEAEYEQYTIGTSI